MDRLTYLTNKQLHPPKPHIGWQVKNGEHMIFKSKEYADCMHFIKTHALKLTPEKLY